MRTFKTKVALYERLSDLSILRVTIPQILLGQSPYPVARLSLEALLPSWHQIATEHHDTSCGPGSSSTRITKSFYHAEKSILGTELAEVIEVSPIPMSASS